jgi:heat shock protein HslJ
MDHEHDRTPAGPAGDAPLEDRDWLLEVLEMPPDSTTGPTATGAPAPVPAAIRVTMRFEAGRVSGSTGCNRFHGSYSRTGDGIGFDPLATTVRACPDDRMAIEGAFLACLARVDRVRLTGTTLELLDGSRPLLRFVAEPPLGLGDAEWSADGVNNGRGGVSGLVEGTTITARFADGRVAGSGGCNRYTGAFEADGGSIRIGPLASTRMACPGAGVSEQETAYIAALERARRFSIVDRRLELRDEDGALQASFRTASLEAGSSAEA